MTENPEKSREDGAKIKKNSPCKKNSRFICCVRIKSFTLHECKKMIKMRP
ncbi:hypothetical protein TFKS16_0313 [Tannerella forsythia KS16]|nr:hypothetical protein TFKS16_0313 [Tannerella forsythia KS16]